MDNNNLVDTHIKITFLDCKESFTHLSEKEKQYSYALIKAGWNGALIDFLQCSPESPALFIVSQKMFQHQNSKEIEELIISMGFNEMDVENFLNYFVMLYGNLGNYLNFGDSKFIPRIAKDNFEAIIFATKAYQCESLVREVFDRIKEDIYLLNERNQQFGLGKDGISTYYSYNCTEEDAKVVQSYLDQNNISAYNTRLFKTENNGEVSYEVRQASSETGSLVKLYHSNSDESNVTLTNGDYSEIMALIVDELKEARGVSLNETEEKMINWYIESFTTGSIDAHKNGSRFWIQDKGPIVENYIGFIEPYRDPIGVRGEFETFVAVVNKKMSRKFDRLVNAAPQILTELPWCKDYEKDTFLQPDFTSLDIINFPVSGMPVGINIPNYDDIRQAEGFKNVSLGNVLSSSFKDPKATMLRECDKEIFVKKAAEAFEVQVGLHELIGHGSGKLFYLQNGEYNFDRSNVKDFLTNGPINNWYKDNETWDSVFTSLGPPFEECRAESVGLYLCSLPAVLDIFGHSQSNEGRDLFYVNWLLMVKSALSSMEMYTPTQQKWRQAHSQARFAILQVLLETGDNFLSIDEITGSDGKPDIEINLDRSKIETIGRPAIGKFLNLLQYYKSTANFKEGSAFFLRYSILDEKFLHFRDIIMSRKSPRGVIIQSVVREGPTGLEIIEYPATIHGMIQSFTDRFKGEYGCKALSALYSSWKQAQEYFLC